MLGAAGLGTTFCSGLHFAADETLAATALLEANGTSHVLVFATHDPSGVLRKSQVFSRAGGRGFADLCWLPSRLTLLAAGGEGIVAIDISIVAHPDQESELTFNLRAARLAGASLVGLGFNATHLGLAAVAAACFTHDGTAHTTAYYLKHIYPGGTAPLTVSTLHTDRWGPAGSVSLHTAGSSLALCYNHAVSVTCVRECSAVKVATWVAEGMRNVAWEPIFGHYLAGVRAGTVVILDRAGTQFASWTPVRKQGPSPGGPSVLWALSVACIGSQRLAVKCGVGSELNGMWPALLFSVLECQ